MMTSFGDFSSSGRGRSFRLPESFVQLDGDRFDVVVDVETFRCDDRTVPHQTPENRRSDSLGPSSPKGSTKSVTASERVSLSDIGNLDPRRSTEVSHGDLDPSL